MKLFSELLKMAIDELNPYGLLPEAPQYEFDSESKKIADSISDISNINDVAEKIVSVFSLSFGEKFTTSDCMIPAKRIVDILQKTTE